MFDGLEEDATIVLAIDRGFPQADVEAIAMQLARSNSLIPGFIAPPAGLVDLRALLYAELIDRTGTVVIVDRNIASRMSRIARDGANRPFDSTTQIAVNLMALSQAMNLDIEPSIAFHELAHRDGNVAANAELRWFRAADHGQARAWIDIALGRRDLLPIAETGPLTDYDLAAPLHRWRCNYAVCLKIAALELSGGPDIYKLRALLDWMVSDFIVAGPAAIFAAMYFGPRSRRRGLIKQLHAPDRERAVAGIQNAAWDITYLSELSRRAREEPYAERRFIFATADRKLADVATCLFIDAEDETAFAQILQCLLAPWWDGAATQAAEAIVEVISIANARPAPFQARSDTSYVDSPIDELERVVRMRER